MKTEIPLSGGEDDWPTALPTGQALKRIYTTMNVLPIQLEMNRHLELLMHDSFTPHRPDLREKITGWRRFRASDGTVMVLRSGWRARLYRLRHPNLRLVERARIRLSKAIYPWREDW